MNRTFEWGVGIATLLSVLSIVPRHCAHWTHFLHPKSREINAAAHCPDPVVPAGSIPIVRVHHSTPPSIMPVPLLDSAHLLQGDIWALLPSGDHMWSASFDQSLRIWGAGGERIRCCAGHRKPVRYLPVARAGAVRGTRLGPAGIVAPDGAFGSPSTVCPRANGGGGG